MHGLLYLSTLSEVYVCMYSWGTKDMLWDSGPKAKNKLDWILQYSALNLLFGFHSFLIQRHWSYRPLYGSWRRLPTGEICSTEKCHSFLIFWMSPMSARKIIVQPLNLFCSIKINVLMSFIAHACMSWIWLGLELTFFLVAGGCRKLVDLGWKQCW